MIACALEPCEHESPQDVVDCRVSGRCAVQALLGRQHHRLLHFLGDVKLADLILPVGMRIDVPVEKWGCGS